MKNQKKIITPFINKRLRRIGLLCICLSGAIVAARAAIIRTPLSILFCMLPALIGIGLFVVNNPILIYWILVISSPFNDHLGISMGGINIRPYSLLASAGVASVLIFFTMGIHNELVGRARRNFLIFIPLILFVISKLSTQIILGDLPSGMTKLFSAKYSVFYFLLFITCFVIATFAGSRGIIYKSIGWWIHITNIIIVIAVFQILLSNIADYHFVHHRDVIFFGRPYSVFREPDVLGSFVGATTLIIIPLIISHVYILPKWYLKLSLYLNSLMVVILFVRAAWLGVIVSLGVWLLCMLKSRKIRESFVFINKAALVGLTGLLLLLILVPSFSNKLLSRFSSLAKPQAEGASEYRLRELEVMFLKSMPKDLSSRQLRTFLFGHGDFAWSYWAPLLLGENYDRAAVEKAEKSGAVLIHAGFNMALTIFFDNGLVGFIVFLSFFILLGYLFLKVYYYSDSEEDKAVLLSLFLPIVCVLICFQFSYDPITPFFWVLIGLFIAMRQKLTYCDNSGGKLNNE